MHRALLRTTYLTGFFLTFHVALISYVNSSFLATKIPESLVGILYTASAILSIIGLYMVPRLISRFGSRKTMGVLVFLNICNLLSLILINNVAIIAACFVTYFAINTSLYLGLDIIIEHWSDSAHEGRVRGIYLTTLNIGFMIAPFVGGFIMDRLGFSALYSFSLIILIPAFIMIGFILPQVTHIHISKINLLGLAKKFLRHRGLSTVFCVNFILQFFYCWMVIYAPIYLHDSLGLGWDSIGKLFTIMLSAFVLFQYIIGKITDRFHNERGLMITGLLIMGIATLAVTKSPTVTFWMIALIFFATRVGASIVEVATESYFFRHVHHDDIGSMGFFRNTYPFAYIVAPVIASGIIKIAPLWSLFIILGIICFLGILIAKGVTQKA